MKVLLLAIVLLSLGFSLGFFVGTWSSNHGDQASTEGLTVSPSRPVENRLPPTAGASPPSAPIRQQAEPLVEDGAESSATVEALDADQQAAREAFVAEAHRISQLKGVERENYLRDHRLEYMKTHRDGILRTLEELEAVAGDRLKVNQKAFFLAQHNIALLLDTQNRNELVPQGESVSIRSEGDNYSFLSGNWVYRFSAAEFPEWVYLSRIRAEKVPGRETAGSYPELPGHILQLLHQRSAMALAAYPGDE